MMMKRMEAVEPLPLPLGGDNEPQGRRFLARTRLRRLDVGQRHQGSALLSRPQLSGLPLGGVVARGVDSSALPRSLAGLPLARLPLTDVTAVPWDRRGKRGPQRGAAGWEATLLVRGGYRRRLSPRSRGRQCGGGRRRGLACKDTSGCRRGQLNAR